MKKLLGIGFITIFLFFASSCKIADDIEYDRREKMNFEVEETKFEDLLKERPELKDREKEIEEFKKEETENVEKEEENGDNKWTVSTGTLNVRQEASQDSEIIGEVSLGDEIVALDLAKDEFGESWIKFKLADGRDGFVNSAYLTKDTDREPVGVYRVVIPTLNIRSEPNEESEILNELTYFDEFSVFDKVDDESGRMWLKIQASGSMDGFGYVLSDYTVELEQ
ncbi:MAG: SH3 domain-containing protein [Tissierellia bacterium]|nr:SH3 domain-containing protein [Tissierellia bacterium]